MGHMQYGMYSTAQAVQQAVHTAAQAGREVKPKPIHVILGHPSVTKGSTKTVKIVGTKRIRLIISAKYGMLGGGVYVEVAAAGMSHARLGNALAHKCTNESAQVRVTVIELVFDS